MTINRRRAASSEISSEKKLEGHKNESVFAGYIEGEVIHGTQKGDVIDQLDFIYSVKSGKKWQIFLYGYDRIISSQHLKILKPCLDAFTEDADIYFEHRVTCIAYKENYKEKNGPEKARLLTNEEVKKAIGKNEYVTAKEKLNLATLDVCNKLKDKETLRKFLDEAIFNNSEVDFLAIKKPSAGATDPYHLFHRDDVLDTFSKKLFPAISKSGNVSIDFNVPGQKTLLCYATDTNPQKNLVEIEIRNDSVSKYRSVRFNMYSADAFKVLSQELTSVKSKDKQKNVIYYGQAPTILGI